MLPRLPDVDCLVAPWSVVVIGGILISFQECATPPHVHPMSRYVITRDQYEANVEVFAEY